MPNTKGVALLLALAGCSVDDRAPANVGAGSSSGSSGSSGASNAGSAGSSAGGSGGSAGQGGSSGSNGGGNGGAAGSSADAGSERGCGTNGDVCCSDGPRCDDGLGCDPGSERCSPCAAFHGTGTLQGFTSSVVQGISGDGQVVVGYAEDGGGNQMAFRHVWASGQGLQALGVLPGGTSSSARAASFDGYAVVGESESSDGVRGFRWTADGLVDLGTWAAGDPSSSASGVSADGNAVALTSTGVDSTRLAYRWLVGGEKTLLIGMEEARDISADGNTIVGNRLGAGNEAVLASIADEVQPLGTLVGDAVAFALALSRDGNVAVGASGSCGCRGFRWTNGTITEALGITRAQATNADGSLIGGNMTATTCTGGRAATWRQDTGTQAVACDLLPAGIIPNGWSLTSVNAISDDGRVLAGEGVNPALASEGWVAVLGPDCRAP